ncbi:MAG TPA: sterol desaturase family protein [Vicinamibacterales bacterium]|nr:sterol desaturase family protein [Vicinamibacterales bacterium]
MLRLFLLDPLKSTLLAAAIFIPFERLAAERPGQRVFRRGWLTDAMTGVLNALVLLLVFFFAVSMVDRAAALIAPGVRGWVAARPLALQVIAAIVIGDLGVYLAHRLMHTVPALWRIHAIHHSADEMDWLVASRFHAVDLLITRFATLAPLIALHVSPAALAIAIALFGWQSYLVHANVRLSYGPLRWLVVSPEFHHWHHGAEREAFDRNYASVIAGWDVLFGTAHLPAGRQPRGYGIADRIPAGYVARFFYPFKR